MWHPISWYLHDSRWIDQLYRWYLVRKKPTIHHKFGEWLRNRPQRNSDCPCNLAIYTKIYSFKKYCKVYFDSFIIDFSISSSFRFILYFQIFRMYLFANSRLIIHHKPLVRMINCNPSSIDLIWYCKMAEHGTYWIHLPLTDTNEFTIVKNLPFEKLINVFLSHTYEL